MEADGVRDRVEICGGGGGGGTFYVFLAYWLTVFRIRKSSIL